MYVSPEVVEAVQRDRLAKATNKRLIFEFRSRRSHEKEQS